MVALLQPNQNPYQRKCGPGEGHQGHRWAQSKDCEDQGEGKHLPAKDGDPGEMTHAAPSWPQVSDLQVCRDVPVLYKPPVCSLTAALPQRKQDYGDQLIKPDNSIKYNMSKMFSGR